MSRFECQRLEEVRAEIDEIDRMNIALIGKRNEYGKRLCQSCGDFKKTGADVRAPDRLVPQYDRLLRQNRTRIAGEAHVIVI